MVLCRNDFADIFLDILNERLGRPQNFPLGLPSPHYVGIINRWALGMCRYFAY